MNTVVSAQAGGSAEMDRAAKAEALLRILEERVTQLEKPREQTTEEMNALKDTVARQEYRIAILVAALREADDRIEQLSRERTD